MFWPLTAVFWIVVSANGYFGLGMVSSGLLFFGLWYRKPCYFLDYGIIGYDTFVSSYVIMNVILDDMILNYG